MAGGLAVGSHIQRPSPSKFLVQSAVQIASKAALSVTPLQFCGFPCNVQVCIFHIQLLRKRTISHFALLVHQTHFAPPLLPPGILLGGGGGGSGEDCNRATSKRMQKIRKRATDIFMTSL